jgi:septal ring factor EnvC (AmiA/AmiB activator)
MNRPSLFSRVGQWFKPGDRHRSGSSDFRPTAPDSYVDAVESEAAESEAVDGRGALVSPALSKRRQREEALARVEEGFTRVVQLCESLQTHFAHQDQRASRIADSLVEVSGGMARLANVVEAQGDTLHAIVGQLEKGNTRSARIEELAGQFSKLTEAQRQALAGIGQQVEAAQKTDQRIVETLDTVQQALTTLGASCSASTQALKVLRMASAETDERMSKLVEQQGRRFVWLFAVTLILATVSVTAVVLGFVL